jgi:hypothetical protein
VGPVKAFLVQFDGEFLFGFAFVFGFFGLFRNESVCFGSETQKETEKIIFWFRETNRK